MVIRLRRVGNRVTADDLRHNAPEVYFEHEQQESFNVYDESQYWPEVKEEEE